MLSIVLRFVLPVLLLLAGVGVFAVVGKRPEPEQRDTSGQDARPLVATEPVTTYDGGVDLRTDGIVVPYREITLAAEVSGVVTYKAPECNEGTYVAAGTKLIEIDARNYEFEVQRLRGEVDQATANMGELEVELANAEKLVPLAERELALVQAQQRRTLQARDAVTEQELEDAERTVIAAQNVVLEARRQRDLLVTRKSRLVSVVEVARSLLEKAQLDLRRTVIIAPVNGAIIRDDVEKDSFVQAGSVLCMIEDTTKVEVRCNLRMEEMRWIWRQPSAPQISTTDAFGGTLTNSPALPQANDHTLRPTEVTVTYELAGQTYTWTGTLDRYDGLGLDEKTRMIPCRIVVDEPHKVSVDGQPVRVRGPRALVRGMFVGLVIHTKPSATLLRVPEKAIQPGGIVWRVRDGKLERVTLHIAQNTEDGALVDAEASNLKAGDALVVSPLRTAFTGLKVREDRDL